MFAELEMDTGSLFLALSELDLFHYIRPEMKKKWNPSRRGDCAEEFLASSTTIFPRTCCVKHKKHDRREPGLF